MNQKIMVLSLLILATAIFMGFLFSNYNQKAATEKFYTSVGNPYQMVQSAPNAGTPVTGTRTAASLPQNLTSMSTGVPQPIPTTSVATKSPASPDLAAGMGGGVSPSDPFGNEVFNPVKERDQNTQSVTPGCFPRDRLTAEDLLPKDAANSLWAQVNPAGQGDVSDQNFLNAGHLVGVNTVGQSLRNANLQLRSEPANPQAPVSPWNISTIEPDLNRRPLEIGGADA